MPALQNLVLADRATTPVNHTFTPRGRVGVDGGRLAVSGVSAIADQLFTIEPRSTPGGRRKVKMTLVRPVVQTKVENGVTSYVVTRTNRVVVEFDMAPDSTSQERSDIVGMIQDSLATSKTLVNGVLINGENVF